MTAIQNKNYQFIFWPLSEPSTMTLFYDLWPDHYEFFTVQNWKEFMEALRRDTALAIIVETSPDDDREDIFSFALQNNPSLLCFQLVAKLNAKQTELLMLKNLVHKTIDLSVDADHLPLTIHETLALIQLVEERNRFAELSITDPVTHLTNHRFFQEKLRQEIHKSKKNKDALSLAMIDVDHFKLLNDQFGHPRGDQILALIAKELKKYLPANASLSRYGGEEFGLILPKVTSQKALQICEELRQAILNIRHLDFRLSISLGISSFPEHGLDADELIANADHALYCAKRQGRNMSIVAGELPY